VANNMRRDHARPRQRDRAQLTREGTLPEPQPALAQVTADDPAERVREALDQLPDSYREVIVLHRWQELSFAEIAKVLGSTEGAVKLRAHRGYLALRKALGVLPKTEALGASARGSATVVEPIELGQRAA
jgi:RNA polymerase sigma-70 factor (ECF subfamily)